MSDCVSRHVYSMKYGLNYNSEKVYTDLLATTLERMHRGVNLLINCNLSLISSLLPPVQYISQSLVYRLAVPRCINNYVN